jgi:osmotically-inducible protein OsmY
MQKDTQIRDDVQRELFFSPVVNSTTVGVAVQDGVVTLTGTVESYTQKLEALRAAGRISGVRAVVCDLTVQLPGPHEWTDTDLARAVANVLAWNSSLPPDRIRIRVENGWITLEGTVDWQYQKDTAVAAVSYLMGVRGVVNLLSVNPMVSAEDNKQQIQAALKRCAGIDARNILVEVHNDKIWLYGEVHSIPEREEAERIAWSAPGVSDVSNHIVVAEPSLAGDRPLGIMMRAAPKHAG